VKLPVAAVLVALSVTGCSRKAKYIDPDAPSKVEGTGIESRDVRAVVAQMTDAIIGSIGLAEASMPPRIAVLPVTNESRFIIDQEIFTTLITDELVQNAKGRLAIVNRDRIDEIMREREMKRRGEVTDDGLIKGLAGVDYLLEGEVRSLSASTRRNQTDYVVIRFQLTDAESSIVSWSSRYEMKKQGSWGVLYQ
ncbi:MAG: CsgG/HfaB family protein, partial [Myxococcota bacterium]